MFNLTKLCIVYPTLNIDPDLTIAPATNSKRSLIGTYPAQSSWRLKLPYIGVIVCSVIHCSVDQ